MYFGLNDTQIKNITLSLARKNLFKGYTLKQVRQFILLIQAERLLSLRGKM